MYRDLLTQQAALASDASTSYADSDGFTLPEMNHAIHLLNERMRKFVEAQNAAALKART